MSYPIITSVADAIYAMPYPYPPISLTKHYKGTTQKQQARILDINPVFAKVQATQQMTFPILKGVIHLLCGIFPGAISATIHPADYTQGTFHLSDLSYGGWRERKAERVQPKSPTFINMYLYKEKYHAYMEDICSEGMGILVSNNIDPGGKLRPGVKLLLEVRLSPEHLFSNLRGTILYRKNINQQLAKCGLHLCPTTNQKIALQAYITQRYDEILNELEQEYNRMREPWHVEDQCF